MMSNRLLIIVLSAVVCVTFGSEPSRAASAAEQEVHALVGTYQCVNRDSAGHVWKFTSVNDAFGAWLRVRVTYPPQKDLAAGDMLIAFVGYDPGSKRWNIVGTDIDGSYYTRSSRSVHFDGSQWKDDYPPDGGKAVARNSGSTRYTFDLTMPAKRGPAMQFRVVCTRTGPGLPLP